jgi:hypothetical protein
VRTLLDRTIGPASRSPEGAGLRYHVRAATAAERSPHEVCTVDGSLDLRMEVSTAFGVVKVETTPR